MLRKEPGPMFFWNCGKWGNLLLVAMSRDNSSHMLWFEADLVVKDVNIPDFYAISKRRRIDFYYLLFFHRFIDWMIMWFTACVGTPMMNDNVNNKMIISKPMTLNMKIFTTSIWLISWFIMSSLLLPMSLAFLGNRTPTWECPQQWSSQRVPTCFWSLKEQLLLFISLCFRRSTWEREKYGYGSEYHPLKTLSDYCLIKKYEVFWKYFFSNK